MAYFTSYFGSYFATGSGSSLPAGSVRKTSVFGVLQGYGVFRRNTARQRLYWETAPAVEPPVEPPAQQAQAGGGVVKKQRPRISYADLAPSVTEAARRDTDDDVLMAIFL